MLPALSLVSRGIVLMSSLSSERILFVTGRLAEGMARQIVAEVSRKAGFEYHIEVVSISVAALMHVDWLARRLKIDGTYDRVIVPGWCQGDLHKLEEHFRVPFQRGPKEIRDLPGFLGSEHSRPADLSRYDIEILAEINHAPQLTEQQFLALAQEFQQSGADLIDVGCIPGTRWPQVGRAVRQLREMGCRVSIDSFDPVEVEQAIEAGAELVLSCNQQNLEAAFRQNVEFVVIPDDPSDLETMWQTARRFAEAGRPCRLDPILEPIGFGFARSLARYQTTRRMAPGTPIMMGIGNVTELSDVDSAGINFLLAAFCQEEQIHSVLTTQVIPWCRTAVAEFDRARRLVKYAIDHHLPPKRVQSDLIMLRDMRVTELGDAALVSLARQIKDPNFRIFVERGMIHVMNRDGHWTGQDAYELFDQFSATGAPLAADHAFYLGYELSKAVTAMTLGKQYRQDESLSWGMLTRQEPGAMERRHRRPPKPGAAE